MGELNDPVPAGQAVARDKMLPLMAPFARGAPKGDEPRAALLATGGLSLTVLLWAGFAAQGNALNLVAKTITMFFLYTYGMMNAAAPPDPSSGALP